METTWSDRNFSASSPVLLWLLLVMHQLLSQMETNGVRSKAEHPLMIHGHLCKDLSTLSIRTNVKSMLLHLVRLLTNQ